MQSKLQMARDMVNAGFYGEARKILRQIEHPDREKWLKQVDSIEETSEYRGELFSDTNDTSIVTTTPQSPSSKNALSNMLTEMIDTRNPWDSIQQVPGWVDAFTQKGEEHTWMTFLAMVVINPYRMILYWFQLQRPLAAVLYGIGYFLIALAFIASLVRLVVQGSSPQNGALLGFSLAWYIAFPFFMVFQQQRVYNRQRNISPMQSHYGLVLFMLFIGVNIFFAWLYSLSPRI